MKKLTLILVMLAAISLSTLSQAREVTFTTQLKNYSGDGAYIVLYLVNENGQYQRTFWLAGTKSKYYKHLPDWARGSGLRSSEYDGVTGASVLSGKTLKVTVDIDDALIDAGYEVRVDTSVEDKRDNRADVSAPLTTDGAGKSFAGRGYVQSFSYGF
ncbi:MAG: DUF2271 domain-containing protein [Thiopseudomonas sp.]|nr:DUF2271 domain-containing protein [Thiopseudomonas sp.]